MLIKLLAKVARRMPKVILQMRYFKHKYCLMNFDGSIDHVDTLMQYINRSALANRTNSRWALMADKYGVREQVARIIGEEHLIPLYGHWKAVDDIDFNTLKTPCVLKTNNGCGTNIYIHNMSDVNVEDIRTKLKKALNYPYPELSGQLHYSLIEPCIIAEKLMDQGGGHKSLTDYKVYCVNGEPQFINVFSDRNEIDHFDFNLQPYTPKWQKIAPGLSLYEVGNDAPIAENRPDCLEQMLDYARRFAKGEEFVRVDFYIIGGQIYFGEQTYTPDVGYHAKFKPYIRIMDEVLERIKRDRRIGISDKTF